MGFLYKKQKWKHCWYFTFKIDILIHSDFFTSWYLKLLVSNTFCTKIPKSSNSGMKYWKWIDNLLIFVSRKKMKAYSKNPWLVENVDDFNFWCCPECAYKSKDRTGNLMSVWLWWVLKSKVLSNYFQFKISI